MKKSIVILFLGALIFLLAFVIIQFKNDFAATTNVDEVKKEIEISYVEKKDTISNTVSERENISQEKKYPIQFFNTYEDNDSYGLIEFKGVESAITVGSNSEELENTAMLHSYSCEEKKVILGHSYKNGTIFGQLYLLKEGDIVTITKLDGTKETFSVKNSDWITEENYESEEGIKKTFDGSNDLKLITCQTKDGKRGRMVVYCNKN